MKKVSLVLSGIMFSGAVAVAEPMKETGGYLGLSYGFTELEDDDIYDSEAIDEFSFFSGDLDTKGRAWQIYGGYRFLKYFSVEGRYTDFGSYDAEIMVSVPLFEFEEGLGKDELEFSALTAHAVGIYPFGQSGFDIYGQLGLGVLWFKGDRRLFDEDNCEEFGCENDDGNTTVFSGGAGVRYTPPGFQALTIQLAYDIYAFKNELFDDEPNQSLSMGKLGIQYNF